jgi:hypothetical protein
MFRKILFAALSVAALTSAFMPTATARMQDDDLIEYRAGRYYRSEFRNLWVRPTGSISVGENVVVRGELWGYGKSSSQAKPVKNQDVFLYWLVNGQRVHMQSRKTDDLGRFEFVQPCPNVQKRSRIYLILEYPGKGDLLGVRRDFGYTVR